MTTTKSVPAQGVTLLGATGSIGMNTLDVLARHPGPVPGGPAPRNPKKKPS